MVNKDNHPQPKTMKPISAKSPGGLTKKWGPPRGFDPISQKKANAPHPKRCEGNPREKKPIYELRRVGDRSRSGVGFLLQGGVTGLHDNGVKTTEIGGNLWGAGTKTGGVRAFVFFGKPQVT